MAISEKVATNFHLNIKAFRGPNLVNQATPIDRVSLATYNSSVCMDLLNIDLRNNSGLCFICGAVR